MAKWYLQKEELNQRTLMVTIACVGLRLLVWGQSGQDWPQAAPAKKAAENDRYDIRTRENEALAWLLMKAAEASPMN